MSPFARAKPKVLNEYRPEGKRSYDIAEILRIDDQKSASQNEQGSGICAERVDDGLV